MENKIQRITVKAVINNGDKILCVQDPKGTWELPGGRIAFGEDPQQTLLRELNEELGLKNIQVQGFFYSWTFTVTKDGIDYQFVVLMYACKAGADDLHISDEHKAVGWKNWETIQKLDMRQGYKDSIRKFLDLYITAK